LGKKTEKVSYIVFQLFNYIYFMLLYSWLWRLLHTGNISQKWVYVMKAIMRLAWA